jgi:TonB-dependent receptor-like protein/carboxypeptidase family protein
MMPWLLLLLTLAPGQLASGELRLVVTDASGLPVRAMGTLASDASQTTRAFDTDAAGRFVFDRLPAGIYFLTVTSAGFATRTETIDVRGGAPRELHVTLSIAPLTASVTVTPPATLVDPHDVGVVYNVGSQQAREQQSLVPGRELLDLVNLQPGWLMESNGVLHPRGSEYQTLVVVDGVPMDDNRSPAFAPELPDGAVEAVSVITGTFPAEYGRKLGGVVDVTTGRDIREGLHVSLESGVGSFAAETLFGSAAYGRRRQSLTVNAGASRTDRYLDAPTEANAANHGRLASVGVAFDDQATDRDRIRLAWRQSDAAFQAPNDVIQEAAGQRQDRHSREQAAQAAWSRVVSSQAMLEVRGAFADLAADFASNAASTPIVVAQQRGFRRGYAKASLAAHAGRHELKVGGDVARAPVHEALQYDITDRSFFGPATPSTFAFAERGVETDAALFAQDAFRFGGVTASAGLRWDRYSLLVHDTAFSPRLAVAWASPDAAVVLRASFDRAFQTPAIENLLLASSPAVDRLNRRVLRLPVPTSRGNFLEGGISAAIARTARLDATLYRRGFSDFADDDVFMNTGVSFPIAFRAAAIRGADVKLSVPSWHRLSGFAGYSYLIGRAELPVTGGLFLGSEAITVLQEDRVPITQDQRHTARARARYQIAPRAWTAVVVRYGSGLPVQLDDDDTADDLVAHYGRAVVDRVDFDERRVRPTLSIDVGVGVELWRRERRRIDLRGEIVNATNRLNVVNFAGIFSGTAIAPPRAATVRARVEF